MINPPFIGPSYQLNTRKADIQRSINLVLKKTESQTGKPQTQYFMESIPAVVLSDPDTSTTGPWRGMESIPQELGIAVTADSAFVFSPVGSMSFTAGSVGPLATLSGTVDIAIGRTQVVIVDGPNGYVIDRTTLAFTVIVDPYFLGSSSVSYIASRFVFIKPGTDQFYISAIDNALTGDPLDFASAEGAPDGLVTQAVDHQELWLFGSETTEVWDPTGAVDFPFQRNLSAFIQVGCQAEFSLCRVDNSLIWIGLDENGGAVVYRSSGYQAVKVSTFAVEEQIGASTNVGGSVAYAYQMDGQTFYCLNVPGLTTTWCFNVSANTWEERADIVGGSLAQHAPQYHMFFQTQHLLGGTTGRLWRFDKTAFRNNYDGSTSAPIYRERTSPHNSAATLNLVDFRQLRLDCSTGVDPDETTDPQVELNISDDGGQTWGNWILRSLGKTGQYLKRIQWNRLGMARDRVWKLRFTGNARFDIVNVSIDAQELPS